MGAMEIGLRKTHRRLEIILSAGYESHTPGKPTSNQRCRAEIIQWILGLQDLGTEGGGYVRNFSSSLPSLSTNRLPQKWLVQQPFLNEVALFFGYSLPARKEKVTCQVLSSPNPSVILDVSTEVMNWDSVKTISWNILKMEWTLHRVMIQLILPDP